MKTQNSNTDPLREIGHFSQKLALLVRIKVIARQSESNVLNLSFAAVKLLFICWIKNEKRANNELTWLQTSAHERTINAKVKVVFLPIVCLKHSISESALLFRKERDTNNNNNKTIRFLLIFSILDFSSESELRSHDQSFSKVCVFSEFDPSTRSRYCCVFKSFHSAERFQKFAYSSFYCGRDMKTQQNVCVFK